MSLVILNRLIGYNIYLQIHLKNNVCSHTLVEPSRVILGGLKQLPPLKSKILEYLNSHSILVNVTSSLPLVELLQNIEHFQYLTFYLKWYSCMLWYFVTKPNVYGFLCGLERSFVDSAK